MGGKRFLIVHYSVYNKDRWGRTFPIAKSLAKLGYQVTLLTSSNITNFNFYNKSFQDGIKIISFSDIIPKFLLLKGFGFISFLLRILYSACHKFDVVYSDCGETPNSGWPCKINQWIYHSKYLSEWGDFLGRGGFYDSKSKVFKFFFGPYFLWSDLYFRKSADVVIVLSTFMKEYAVSRGVSENKIVTIPGGALCDILKEINPDKSEINLSDDVITFGYIGIDDNEIKDLLPFISVLQDDKYHNKFRIVVYGKKLSSGVINKYKLKNLLIECGWVNYYEDCHTLTYADIFLLIKSTNISRSSAGWPNKLGDYMALGRPVLLNLYGDIKEFVNKYPSGFIMISLDQSSISEQLDKIIENEYCLKEMGHKNRIVAEENISWDARVKKLVNYLNNLN